MEEKTSKDSLNSLENIKTGKKTRAAPSGVLEELLFLIFKIAALAAAFLLAFTLVFGVFRYDDDSMKPAVKGGDLVLFYRLDKRYVKSDTLVLEYQGKKQVRRIVAVAGDEVDITDEGLMVNGSLQEEPDIYETTKRFDTGVNFPLTVGQGQVFVLGDAREASSDSRVYGCVNVKDTMGKVMTIVRRRGI